MKIVEVRKLNEDQPPDDLCFEDWICCKGGATDATLQHSTSQHNTTQHNTTVENRKNERKKERRGN
jgi:hypothetical protein